MPKYYEVYKTLILACTFSGIYISSIEKIYGSKWYIKSLKLLCLLPVTSVSMLLLSSVKYQIFDEDSLENKMYGYGVITFVSYICFTFFSFNYYRKDFVRAFELWDSMFQEELYPEDKEELLRRNRRITNSWLTIFGSLTVFSCFVYFMIMFTAEEKKVAHPTGFPYRYQSPDFELMNSLDLIAGTFGFASVIACDTTMMVLLSLEEAEIVHLKRSLARIADAVAVTDDGNMEIDGVEVVDPRSGGSGRSEMKTAFERADETMRIWIRHHQQLLRFHKELEKIFSVLYSAKLLIFVLIICLICFLSITRIFRTLEISLAIVLSFNIYALFYVNATFADSTSETAASIFQGAFGKSWYLYPTKQRTAFNIIIMRSHTSVQYVSFKIYPLNSKTFLKVLTSAYSFFTFMLQLNRNKVKSIQP